MAKITTNTRTGIGNARDHSSGRSDEPRGHGFGRVGDDSLHGCKTAGTESHDDNITADFSTQLAKAGKTASIVIGHADKANPNIKGGGEKNSEQDYRHGQRVIFSKGKIVKVTKQKGQLIERDLEALAEGSTP